MTPHTASLDRQELAQALQAQLLARLAAARQRLGLTQGEVAERIGRNRMTVQRAESEGAGVSMATFVELALALNVTPTLQEDRGQEDPEVVQPLPADIVHRGTHYNRTRHDLHWRDRQREAALAQAWQAVNVRDSALSPVMDTLVPLHTQEQASAVATAIQWLGSEVGFDFLTRALGVAGYAVTDVADSKPASKTGSKSRKT